METGRPILDLLDAAESRDVAVAGTACRELLKRSSECRNYIDRLIELLRNSNAAIADYAFRTLERIGQPAVEPLKTTCVKSAGEFRRLLMGLIVTVAPFDDYFPLLRSELSDGEQDCRYWAANCLGRKYNDHANWPPDAIKALDDAVEVLVSLRAQPKHWPQARMTLKRLGRLPND